MPTIPDLTEVTALASGDMFPVVDVSDTSGHATGTDKRVTLNSVKTSLSSETPVAGAIPRADGDGKLSMAWLDSVVETKHLFLAPRTDGKPGSGNCLNPLNVSTAALFDAVFTQDVRDTVIHLHPGVYLTHGSKGGIRGLYPRTKVIGAGSNQTIVRMAPTWSTSDAVFVGNTTAAIFASLADGNTENYAHIELHGMTLDVNCANLVNGQSKSLIGVYIFSDYAKLTDLKVINSSDFFGNSLESFPFAVYGKHICLTDAISQGHRFSNTGTNVGHTLFSNPGRGAAFTRCIADLTGMSGTSYSHAFGAAGPSSFRDCVIYGSPSNTTSGWWGDTPLGYPETDMYIHGCRCFNINGGVIANYMKFHHMVVSSNYFQLSTETAINAQSALSIGYPTSELWYSVFENNLVEYNGTPSGVARAVALYDNCPKGFRLMNNTFEVGLGVHMTDPGNEIWAIGNRYTDGSLPINSTNSRNMAFSMPGVTVP